ncbi:TPA: hypothetical protein JGU28_004426 [Salmonella enterica]|nr:hypothetical protein [Salmonella enterica]
MKSLEKGMLRCCALFCITFADKYREGLSASELKEMVINMSLTMRVYSVNPNATRTYEQYGEIMESLVSYLACEDDENANKDFDCYSVRTKLSITNNTFKAKIQNSADRFGDLFSKQIEAILAKA